jgi:hypothetical protein
MQGNIKTGLMQAGSDSISGKYRHDSDAAHRQYKKQSFATNCSGSKPLLGSV